jgi:ribosomal-protein-alanine N-acetyltransferase
MHVMSAFPDLETERLYLRRLDLADLAFVQRHFSDPRVCEYLVDEDPLSDSAGAVALIESYTSPERDTANRWVLVIKSTGEAVGTCGYHNWSRRNRSAEIGYDLAPDFWRQGYMSEAMTRAIGHGFGPMGLNRIQAFAHVKNEPSLRMLARLGFQQEGLIREKYLSGGQYHDHFCLSLLAKEWHLSK